LKSAAELVQSIDLNLGRSRQKVRQLQSEIQSLATNLKQIGADAFITDPNLRKFLEGQGGLEVMYPDLDVNYSVLLTPGQEVLQYTADR